jgi:glycosyltransferase involved in cell wall biosynthesis
VALEVCVVDDGSAAPAPYGFADDERVRIFRHAQSRGVAASRNRGVAEARGEWIAFLDDDDVWAPSHLEGLLRAVREQGARWAFSGYVHTTLTRAPIYDGPVPAVEADHVGQILRANPVGTPSCALVAAAALDDAGGFDEALSVMADWELWVRLAIGGRPAVSRAFTVGYAQHPGAMSLDVDRVQAEWAYVATRHEDALVRLGLVFADNQYFWRWLARGYAWHRRRRDAIRYFLRAAGRGGGGRDVVRALAVIPVLGWPILLARRLLGLFRRRRRLRRAASARHAWLQPFEASPAAGAAGPLGWISQRWRVRTRPSP